MTTREELVALADEMKAFLDRSTMNSMAEEFLRKVVSALRLASRQEVSVEELAMSMHSTCASVIVPQGEEIVARALLAEYHITKRTTEG